MARPKNPVPRYLHHKGRGLARVRIGGRDIYLGPYGSPESKREYDRIRAEFEAAAAKDTPPATVGVGNRSLTVAQVVEAFWGWAEGHYRGADGRATTEIGWLKESLADVIDLYGHTPAAEFGPVALKAVRAKWVKADLARTTVNGRTNRVRRVFKWAAGEELVPVAVYQALATVPGLQKGRGGARESSPVEPVHDLVVAATLPHLTATVRLMVLFQRLTGCRPQDVCGLTPAQLDRTGTPWLYRPRRHKTEHRGATRTVYVGPAAAELIAPLLAGRDPDRPVFDPQEARAERYAALRSKRKSKVQPSQQASRAKPAWELKRGRPAVYGVRSYAQAVGRAAGRAGLPHWHPNQLRHSFATEVRAVAGLEAAQVLLGHTRADVTQVYAERDAATAAAWAAKIG